MRQSRTRSLAGLAASRSPSNAVEPDQADAPVNVLFNYAAARNTCPLTSSPSSSPERACNRRDDPFLGDTRDLRNSEHDVRKRK